MPWYRCCNTCGGIIDNRGCCDTCDREGYVQPGHVYCYGQENKNQQERNYYMTYASSRDDLWWKESCRGRWQHHPEQPARKEWIWVCESEKE